MNQPSESARRRAAADERHAADREKNSQRELRAEPFLLEYQRGEQGKQRVSRDDGRDDHDLAGDEADKPNVPQFAMDRTNAYIVGPGDPDEETGRQDQQAGNSKGNLSVSLASLYRDMTVGAGDDADKPVEAVEAKLPVIGPGDPNEETGTEQAIGGGSKPQPAPAPATLPNVSAGDEADKPTISHVENADYTNFIVGPGDPRDEG